MKSMVEHVKRKSLQVQLNTSKKVIKKFHKNIKTDVTEVQTSFRDDEVIKTLEWQLANMKEKLDDLRKTHYEMKCDLEE